MIKTFSRMDSFIYTNYMQYIIHCFRYTISIAWQLYQNTWWILSLNCLLYVIKCLLDCMFRSASLENVEDVVIWLISEFWSVDETSVLIVVLWLIFFSFDENSMFKVVLGLMLEFSSLDKTLFSKVELWLILKSIPVNETSVPIIGLSGVLMPMFVVSVANTVIVAVSVFVKHNHISNNYMYEHFSHKFWQKTSCNTEYVRKRWRKKVTTKLCIILIRRQIV